jgi:hypothetical protein
MEKKSKRNISIYMIIGGLIVIGNYIIKIVDGKTNKIAAGGVIICASIFVLIGCISLNNSIKKERNETN